jgi:hypothetical protein
LSAASLAAPTGSSSPAGVSFVTQTFLKGLVSFETPPLDDHGALLSRSRKAGALTGRSHHR